MKVFIDLGAYNGDTLQKAMQEFPFCDKYIGIEPFTPNFKALQKRFEGDKRVELIQAVAWSHGNGAKMYYSRDVNKAGDNLSVGNSLIYEKTNVDKDRYESVPSIDFPVFLMKRFTEEDYVILKIDIEGAEYELLECLLANDALKVVDKIFVEWHISKIPAITQERHDKLLKRLNMQGFALTGNSRKDEFVCK